MLGVKWNFGNPGSTQKPLFLPFGPVHTALRGLPYSNIVPVNRYVHLIISMPIYALSCNRFDYVQYMCWLIIPIKEGKLLLCF